MGTKLRNKLLKGKDDMFGDENLDYFSISMASLGDDEEEEVEEIEVEDDEEDEDDELEEEEEEEEDED